MATMYAEAGWRRFTVGDLDRMVEAGILDPEEHIELLDGEILTVGKQGPTHQTATIVVRELLTEIYHPRAFVQDHSNVYLDDFNFPEPDTAVIRGQPSEYWKRTPTAEDVVLIVEVTVTSHARDRRKARNYARAGIAEYWMLDEPARTLTVHRQPEGERYGSVTVLDEDGVVEPPGTDATVAVRTMLPPDESA